MRIDGGKEEGEWEQEGESSEKESGNRKVKAVRKEERSHYKLKEFLPHRLYILTSNTSTCAYNLKDNTSARAYNLAGLSVSTSHTDFMYQLQLKTNVQYGSCRVSWSKCSF